MCYSSKNDNFCKSFFVTEKELYFLVFVFEFTLVCRSEQKAQSWHFIVIVWISPLRKSLEFVSNRSDPPPPNFREEGIGGLWRLHFFHNSNMTKILFPEGEKHILDCRQKLYGDKTYHFLNIRGKIFFFEKMTIWCSWDFKKCHWNFTYFLNKKWRKDTGFTILYDVNSKVFLNKVMKPVVRILCNMRGLLFVVRFFYASPTNLCVLG